MQTNKSIKHYYSRSLEIMKGEGLFSFASKACNELKESAFTTNDAFWFTRDLTQPTQEINLRKKIEVEFNSDGETIDWLRKNHTQYGWMYLPEEIEVKKKEQHYFPTVREGNKIIGYTKVGVNNVYIMDFDQVIPLPEKTAFVYDFFVLPEYRGFAIAPYLMAEVIKLLRNSNFRSLWCHIPPWNKASINFCSKVGFKKIDHIRYVRLFGWKWFTRNIPKMMAQRR